MPMSFVMPDKSFPTHVALVLFLPLHCVGTRLACPSQTVTALDPTLTGHAVGRLADEALRVIVATCGVLALHCRTFLDGGFLRRFLAFLLQVLLIG